MDSLETQKRIEKTLSHSTKDAGWYGLQAGFGESFLAAFAVFLQASTFQLGLLGSMPHLISTIFQLIAVKLTTFFNHRKPLIVWTALLQAITWPIMIVVLYFYPSFWVFFSLVALFYAMGSLGGPFWFSLMGDLVPEKFRGRYFGIRNRISGFVAFLCVTIAGAVLDAFSTQVFLGFAILFLLAFIGRAVSVYYLFLHFEPTVELREVAPLSFGSFIRRMRENEFGKFTFFLSTFMFGAFIFSPLFAFFWLDLLDFSYFQFSILVAVGTISTFITMTSWGRAADKHGTKEVLRSSGALLCIIPFIWLLPIYISSFAFLFSVLIQILSGIGWAGFNLGSSNHIYELVKPEERIRLIAYHNGVKGIGIVLGGVLGGFLAGLVFFAPIGGGIVVVLLLSGILRSIVYLLTVNRFKNKEVHQPNLLYYTSWIHVHGMFMDSVVGMNRTIKKFKSPLRKVEEKLDYWESKNR